MFRISFAANSIEIKVVPDTIVSIVKVLIPKLLLKQLQFLAPYFNLKTHTSRCKAKCKLCCTLAWNTPCTTDGTDPIKCAGCNKVFNNMHCYNTHLADDICSLYKKCDKCGQNYRAKRKNKDEYGNVRPIYHQCKTEV